MNPAKPLIALLVLGAVFFLLEKLAGAARPQPFFRRGFLTDVLYLFLATGMKAVTRVLVIIPAALLVVLGLVEKSAFTPGPYAGHGPLAAQPLWLQTVELYLLADFIGYWMHRAFHSGRLWPFHAVHHSSEDLDWLGSVRVHPVNELVNNLVQVVPLILLGFNPVVAVSVAPALTLYAIFLHANLNWDFGPLRAVIATPVFHRWHHSKDPAAVDRNFAGLLPLWDILFGTYYMPRDRMPDDFGIQEPMPSGFLAQLKAPFVWDRPPQGGEKG